MQRDKIDIRKLFDEQNAQNSFVTVAAPMVRYSKLHFRQLLRKYRTQLCFTPMIIADSFNRSSDARKNEFTTNEFDRPLIAQFAAKNTAELLTATELICPYVDGIDLNCGCPQRWAIGKGYGCALLRQPELLCDMIKTVKRNLPQNFSVSVKMRLLERNDIQTTVNLCRQLEYCDVTFLTIHGRTPWQKTSETCNRTALHDIKQSINIPLICNGDIKTSDEAIQMHNEIGCDGVMVARGLLANPTLFMGTNTTTKQCLLDWLNIATLAGNNLTFQCFHHHLTFMMERWMNKSLRRIFNNLTRKDEVFEFIYKHFNITPTVKANEYDAENFSCIYNNELYKKYYQIVEDKDESNNDVNDSDDWNENNNGIFFTNFNI